MHVWHVCRAYFSVISIRSELLLSTRGSSGSVVSLNSFFLIYFILSELWQKPPADLQQLFSLSASALKGICSSLLIFNLITHATNFLPSKPLIMKAELSCGALSEVSANNDDFF